MLKSLDDKYLNIGEFVWVAGFEPNSRDTFYKPIKKELKPSYINFYADFQNCVEYCKKLNAKQ